jgi:hypothetical protein
VRVAPCRRNTSWPRNWQSKPCALGSERLGTFAAPAGFAVPCGGLVQVPHARCVILRECASCTYVAPASCRAGLHIVAAPCFSFTPPWLHAATSTLPSRPDSTFARPDKQPSPVLFCHVLNRTRIQPLALPLVPASSAHTRPIQQPWRLP